MFCGKINVYDGNKNKKFIHAGSTRMVCVTKRKFSMRARVTNIFTFDNPTPKK
jgi:hypothetical protein